MKRDRDVLAHIIWRQDPDTLTVTMRSSASVDKMAEVNGRHRLVEANASWVFEPLADGRVHIINEAHIDPGSALPGWATDMLLVDTLVETMKAFVAEVREPEYQESAVSFIRKR